jgi:hypothetical protein
MYKASRCKAYGKYGKRRSLTCGDGFHILRRNAVSLTPYYEHCASGLDRTRVLLLNEMLDGKSACLWNADKRGKRREYNTNEVSTYPSTVEK